jgi:hypothetical protein
VANRAQRGVWQLAMDTEDCIGDASEMQSRLASGIWPTPKTRLRVIRRCNEMIPALRALRRELELAQGYEDDNRPPPAARGRVRARRAA